MFETARTTANGLLASAGCTRVNGNRHAELMGGRCQCFHLVIEPRYLSRIVAGTEIATSVT